MMYSVFTLGLSAKHVPKMWRIYSITFQTWAQVLSFWIRLQVGDCWLFLCFWRESVEKSKTGFLNALFGSQVHFKGKATNRKLGQKLRNCFQLLVCVCCQWHLLDIIMCFNTIFLFSSKGSGKENIKMSKKPPNRPGITFEIGARLEALDYLQKWYGRPCVVFASKKLLCVYHMLWCSTKSVVHLPIVCFT